MKRITLNCDYVQGFLRDGHFEAILDDKEYDEFLNSSIKEKQELIRDLGKLIIDNYRVEDYDMSDDFTVEDYGN